ncbi:hypothetical protein [Arthrobacter sp. ISL-69]|uniref:hypothetical protein n=1 Tax=Arthrobacter sp. ISL-69 TaxID=2819113 RepID=UPI001BE6EA87|nr:hypothetical protein [Arthrobacter sp. ISL-69]MBT2535417.1 hypothetical protein [Arthrobacter sp. ISL-69]
MDSEAIWATLAAVASAIAAFVSWMTAHTALKTSRRQHSVGLLADLTTGEVAGARDRIGNWLYGTHDQHSRISKPELIQAYYVVAWALERLAVGRTALRVMRFGDKQALKESDARLLWHVEEQAQNLRFIANFVKTIDNREVEDSLRSIQKQIPYLQTSKTRSVSPCDTPGCWRRPGEEGVLAR